MLKTPFRSTPGGCLFFSSLGHSKPLQRIIAALCMTLLLVLATNVNLPASGTGLVGYWSFNEGAGITAEDLSGNGNTGTLINDPTWDQGRLGYGLMFNGINDYVAIPHSETLNVSQELTVSAWILNHTSSNHLLEGPEYHVIASKGWAPDRGGSWTLAWEKKTNAIVFFVRRSSDKGYNYVFFDYPGLTRDWHKITAVFKKGSINLYVDGELVAGAALGSIRMNTTSDDLRIGAALTTPHDAVKSWDGVIDEVQIYNRALDDTEIKALFDAVQSQPSSEPSGSSSDGLTVGTESSIGESSKPGKGNAPVATPTISPNGGEFSNSLSITLSTETSGASIYYTTNGQSPTESSHLYKGPFTITSDTMIKAKAFKKKSPASSEASAWFAKSQKFAFALSNAGNRSANKGSSVQNTISAALKSGNSQAIAFSASGLPSGASSVFSAASCNPTCSSTLSIMTTSSTPTGTYPITVTGTGGGMSESTSFNLTVSDPAMTQPLDFSLAHSGNQSVTAGSSVINTITATLVSGTSQAVSFSVAGLPSGATGSFSPGGCSPNCTSTLTILAGAGTAPGTYTVTVTGSSGGVTKTTSFSLTVSSPTTTSCPTGQFLAEYYNNRTLSGSATFARCESSINYNWGLGGPGNGLATDNFSVRWTGSFNFNAGTYAFTVTADDGVRVWVDGNQIIDAWLDQPATTYQAARTLTAGEHVIKVEYYENGGYAVAQVGWQLAPAKLTVTWQDNSDNEDSFRVERKTGTSGTYGEIAVVAANTTSYVDASITSGSAYCYRVRAANSHGFSSYSNEACQTIP